MPQTLLEHTKAAPDCGVETTPVPAGAISRASTSQGFLIWLPAICILIGMPLMAFATTKYFLLPSIKRVYAQEAALTGESGAGQDATTFLARIPLNPPGARGVHSGIRGFALVGADSDFEAKVDQNRTKLTNLGNRILSGVTVSDLDRPGALDAIRARLLIACNQALGGPVAAEVYISKWPGK